MPFVNFKHAISALCLFSGILITSLHAHAAAENPKLSLPSGVQYVQKGSYIENTPEVWKFKFSNGLRVLILPDFRNPKGYFEMRLHAGSNREKEGHTGLAHFFEHMMFRKTQNTPEGHFDKILSLLGGEGNAATSTDFVYYYETFPGPALETILQLESARFQNLDLTEPYFSTEKGAVAAERGIRINNNPLARAQEILNRHIFRGSPYAVEIIGVDVEKLTIEQAKTFYKTFYRPDNAVLLVGGPFEVEPTIKLIHKYFGNWEKPTQPIPEFVKMPENFPARDAGKRFVCSTNSTQQVWEIIYASNKNTSYENLLFFDAFTKIANDSKEGSVARRFQKNNLATDVRFINSYSKILPMVTVRFTLNKDQKFDESYNFWLKIKNEIESKPIDERVRKILYKAVISNEAESALKMTSLVQGYMDGEFFYNDFLLWKKDKIFAKDLNEKTFRKWMTETFNDSQSIIKGIVLENMAEPCEQWEKKIQEKN